MARETALAGRFRAPLPRGRARTPGFTLIEVVVAMAILSLSLTSLLLVRDRCLEQATLARTTRWAGMLAGKKLGEVERSVDEKGKSCTYGKSASGTFEKREGYGWKLTQENWERKIVDTRGDKKQPHSYAFLRCTLVITDPDQRTLEYSWIKKPSKP